MQSIRPLALVKIISIEFSFTSKGVLEGSIFKHSTIIVIFMVLKHCKAVFIQVRELNNEMGC